jgi:hypothetical protein
MLAKTFITILILVYKTRQLYCRKLPESANVKIVDMTGKIVSNRDFKSIANNKN